MELHGKQVLVLGLGISGRAAARLLLQRGAEVFAADDHWERATEHVDYVELASDGLKRFQAGQPIDFAVLSPGIPHSHPLLEGLPVVGEMELALRLLPDQRIVGITGTNGKTTTTLLVAHILEHAKVPARALGNVGTPLSAYALDPKPEETLVLELSSYQLEALESPRFETGVILNITPDHLDRYGTMERYAAAKARLSQLVKAGGHCWLHESTRNFFPEQCSYRFGLDKKNRLRSDAKQVFLEDTVVFKWPESYIDKKGPDIDNALAAFAICSDLGLETPDFVNALTKFSKLPHRCEFVRELNGVSYYNDSKGTNVDAVLKAVDALPGPIILIAGGKDKGASYAPWRDAFGPKVKAVMAIGEAAPKIQRDLGETCPIEKLASLDEALRRASQKATPGAQVLLSPGCSSFDMFRNYEERGEMFKELVHALAREKTA